MIPELLTWLIELARNIYPYAIGAAIFALAALAGWICWWDLE